MLDALVLADGTTEHLALLGILGSPAQGVLPKPDRFDRNKDPLGIEAVEYIFEAPALLADQILVGHKQVVDEDGIRVDRIAAKFGDATDLDLGAVKISVEDRHAMGRLGAFIFGRRAGKQQEDRKSTRLNSSH